MLGHDALGQRVVDLEGRERGRDEGVRFDVCVFERGQRRGGHACAKQMLCGG